ncbi:MAG: fused response regulator/phosphatase [Gammaproteobacteria bacterium]
MLESTAGYILIVDEDAEFTEAAKAYLEDSDFQVVTSTAEDSLDYLRENAVNVVLSEIKFETTDGHELLSSIIKEFKEIPVIVVSSSDQISDVIDALRLGAWNFFQKPVTNLAILEHAICRALEKYRLELENESYRSELEKINKKLKESLAVLEEDQIAGRNVQLQLLPPKESTIKNIEISYEIMPSLYLSGDFVDYFQISENKLGFYIADVSGHGASSAFITVLLKSYFEKILADYKSEKSDIILHPDKVLKLISDYFFSIKLGKYLTMDYFVLDKAENKIAYSIGGHYPSPILYDGESAKFLEGSGFAVGIFDKANFSASHMTLPESYQLTLFSDGILEIMKGDNLKENEAALLTVLSKGKMGPKDLTEEFEIDSFESLPDDIAFFILRNV